MLKKAALVVAIVVAAGISGGLVGGGAAIALVRTAYNGPTQRPAIPELAISSRELGEPIPLRIHLPSEYESRPDFSFPVLWVLDGRSQGAQVSRSAGVLSRAGVTESWIIVEVESSSRGRSADFTPPWETTSDDAQADRFLEFLRSEAMPAVGQAYRVKPRQVLVGHSLGGLFALYALVTDPLLFDGYFVFSPSVWVGNDEILRELEGAARTGLAAPTSLFLSLGDREGNEMLSGFEAAEQSLGSWHDSQLRWHAEITTGADHGTNPALSFPAALRWYSDESN